MSSRRDPWFEIGERVMTDHDFGSYVGVVDHYAYGYGYDVLEDRSRFTPGRFTSDYRPTVCHRLFDKWRGSPAPLLYCELCWASPTRDPPSSSEDADWVLFSFAAPLALVKMRGKMMPYAPSELALMPSQRLFEKLLEDRDGP